MLVVETYLINEIGNNIAFESYAKKKIRNNGYDYDNDNKINMTESKFFESDLKSGELDERINFIKKRAMSGIFD
jgi:hypothetical protein